ncbi:DUF2330 domain-containing protein [Desulfothermobacter acidiphilus]|uniref:DUF2330 domain-containing protein n=1 Tax=Desulfothermobacter acidiphilus TaxID=1938353 RepID=UPI003F8964B7
MRRLPVSKTILGLVALAVLLFCVNPLPARADMGIILPEPVRVEEPGQTAFIAFNGREEVLLLGTDVKVARATTALQFTPFPSPPKVALAPDDAFARLQELLTAHHVFYWKTTKGAGSPEATLGESEPAAVLSHQKLGLHDVTVVEVKDAARFAAWVQDYFRKQGWPARALSAEEKATVADYCRRGFRYFVIDRVELKETLSSVPPLTFRFQTPALYYPLKVTNLFGGEGEAQLIVCGGERILNRLPVFLAQTVPGPPWWQESTRTAVAPRELAQVAPGAEKLFAGEQEFQAFRYRGKLSFCADLWAENQALFWIGKAYYEAGGRRYSMDAAPYVSGGRTYVPVRYLAYALGVPEEGVRWDGAAQTVSLRKGDVTLRLKLGSPLLERQAGTGPSVSLVMDVAPEMRSDRVFLPARYVAAGLGYSAVWDPATQQVTLAPGEIAWVEELVFDPNPVEPDKGLSILVRTSGPASRPVVRLIGAGGSAEPNEYWRQADKITLSPGGPGEWVAGFLPPGQVGVYPAEVTVEGLTFTAGNWLLKVCPEGFLNQPGYATPEEAVRARFAQDFKGCSLREIEERPLLPDDRRDPRYHKLFLITFYQPYDGPVLPAGTHIYFYYIIKDGPAGLWCVAGGGTGP